MDPIADIKAAHGGWKIITRVRQLLQQAEKIKELVLHIAGHEKRITELEKRLERCPLDGCPKCGALAWRQESSEPTHIWTHHYGARIIHWSCNECGHKGETTYYPPNMPAKP
jgi:uncharacterized protein with PIN domain